MESTTTIHEVYPLNGSENPVSFHTLISSSGQNTSTDVILVDALENKTDLYKEHPGNVPVTTLGTNTSLKGARLFISCAINATSDASKYCEELVVVSGGNTPATHFLNKSARIPGELSMLTCIVVFR